MASWVVVCKNCTKTFDQSKIEDTLVNHYEAPKPVVPYEGQSLKCPHCGFTATYFRSDLLYQRAAGA